MTNPQLPLCYVGIDPCLWATAKLFIRDFQLVELHASSKGIFCHRSRYFSKVAISGIIVEIDVRKEMIMYMVDDGTGALECTYWTKNDTQNNPVHNNAHFELGQLVNVIGKANLYKEKIHLLIDKMEECPDIHDEWLGILERIYLDKHVYSKALVVSKEDMKTMASKIGHAPEQHKNQLKYEKYEDCVQGICKSPMVTIKDLCILLRLYFQEKDIKRFLFSDIIKDINLSNPFRRFMMQTMKPMSESLLIDSFIQVIAHLKKEGLIYLKDVDSDEYEVLSYEAQLKNELKRIITREQLSAKGGVSKEVVFMQVKKVKGMQNVQKQTIYDSLIQLEKEGILDKNEDKSYSINE